MARAKANLDYVLNQIRSKVSIKDYLRDKHGCLPEVESAGRASYKCPIHGDTNPSLMVYDPNTKYDYENYHCFGCKSHGDIVTMVAELEYGGRDKKAWSQALRKLSADAKVDIRKAMDSIGIDTLEEFHNQTLEKEIMDPFERVALTINQACFAHLSMFKFNKEEVEFIEKIMKTVDKSIWTYDMDTLEYMCDFLLGEEGLQKRAEYIVQKQERDALNHSQKMQIYNDMR